MAWLGTDSPGAARRPRVVMIELSSLVSIFKCFIWGIGCTHDMVDRLGLKFPAEPRVYIRVGLWSFIRCMWVLPTEEDEIMPIFNVEQVSLLG